MLLVETGVQFFKISPLMSSLLMSLAHISMEMGEDITITGADGERYRPGGAHRQGRALDLRTFNLSSPYRLIMKLKERGWPFLYGAPDHLNHIHVQTDGICR